MGFNSRIPSVDKFDAAKDALTKAKRDYNSAVKVSSSSGEARTNKADAQKALKRAQSEYDRLRKELIDDINEYDYIEKMKNITK